MERKAMASLRILSLSLLFPAFSPSSSFLLCVVLSLVLALVGVVHQVVAGCVAAMAQISAIDSVLSLLSGFHTRIFQHGWGNPAIIRKLEQLALRERNRETAHHAPLFAAPLTVKFDELHTTIGLADTITGSFEVGTETQQAKRSQVQVELIPTTTTTTKTLDNNNTHHSTMAVSRVQQRSIWSQVKHMYRTSN
jgi:hypothetical protein